MNYPGILSYIRDGNEDGVEYALEWIAEESDDPRARILVNAVFDARDSEDDSNGV